jgi:lipopolysaccharide transport system ATP-binding protein
MIPHVRPMAREVYPSRGAEIRDPHVETVDGQRVNVLSPGDSYVYKYEVAFARAIERVSCWMALVDEQGNTIVSNGTSRHFGEYESIAEGCRLCVEFEYVCQQCPGVYSLNAGVMTAEAGAAEYAHRIVGAALIVVRLARAELAAGPPRVSVH